MHEYLPFKSVLYNNSQFFRWTNTFTVDTLTKLVIWFQYFYLSKYSEYFFLHWLHSDAPASVALLKNRGKF